MKPVFLRVLSPLTVLVGGGFAANRAHADAPSGTFLIRGPKGAITLTLARAQDGEVSGSLSGGPLLYMLWDGGETSNRRYRFDGASSRRLYLTGDDGRTDEWNAN